MYNGLNGSYAGPLSFGPVNFAPLQIPSSIGLELSDQDRIPPGYAAEGDGAVRFRFYYPNAGQVSVNTPFLTVELENREGFWTGTVWLPAGFTPVWLTVDGSLTISPYLPLCFSDNRPLNFVDLPDGINLCDIREVPHGVVVEDFIPNSVTRLNERIRIYLPPTAFSEPARRFPVLYLQHGIGENETAWTTQGRLNFMLDNLLAQRRAEPVMVVMCNGMLTLAGEKGSRLHCGLFHDFLIRDVIPHIEKRYPAAAGRENRVMAGLSMGSIQTSRAALLHPGLFRAIGLFSGFLSDLLGGYNDHLTPKRLAAFRDGGTYLFRAMGDEDPFLPVFIHDDGILTAAGIGHERRIYHGNHEWNVWRRCFADFVQLVFGSDRAETGI